MVKNTVKRGCSKSILMFASRSPARPNPIGLSIVRLKKVVGNEVFTSGLDVFDNTPLLDIKPYINDLDSKHDANYGWIDNLSGNKRYFFLHIMGIRMNSKTGFVKLLIYMSNE